METAAPLLYRRLDPSTSEIRLLEVPSDGSEDWGLITVSLNDNPKYFALSYVWGEKKDLDKIILQGQDVKVTPNLASALSRIRSGNLGRASTPIKYLWVDAICINQEDNEERSKQVQFMHHIFICAEAVYAWVGQKDYSLAFQTIKTLADEAARHYPSGTIPDDRDELDIFGIFDMPPFKLEWLQQYPSLCDETSDAEFPFKNDAWNSVMDLFLDQYWKRVWIYQEVVLARQLHLFSLGGMTLSRQDLFMFAQSYTELELESKVDKGEVQRPEFLCQTVWDGLIRFPPHHGIDAIRNARCITTTNDAVKSTRGSWAKWLFRPSWKESIAAARLVATDPRDYIYGLLAISKIPMKPDYTKSVTEVYTEFVECWIEASLEARGKPIMLLELSPILPLGFLSLAGVGYFGSSDDFPSWAPHFPQNALQNETRLLNLAASQSLSQEDPERYPYLVRDTGSLVVLGAEIEPVLHVSNFARPACFDGGTLQKFVFDIGHSFRRYTSRHPRSISGATSWQDIACLLFKKASKTVTRAMVFFLFVLASGSSEYVRMNHPDGLGSWDSPDSSLFPTDWETQLYQRAFPDEDLKKLGFSDNPFADKESQKDEALRHLIPLCLRMADRSIFETKRGYLGRGPLDVREGDRLCILKDYDQPVLLRKLGDHYTFVGTVFVVDLNPGEWIRDNPSGLEWLKLR
ncbi:HET domain-containing protein [Fusarium sp. Ph1]|nr:HET domain-containing protein [Fusarium sp. Ph1]